MWVLNCGKGGDVLLEFVVSVEVSLVMLLSDAVELWFFFVVVGIGRVCIRMCRLVLEVVGDFCVMYGGRGVLYV